MMETLKVLERISQQLEAIEKVSQQIRILEQIPSQLRTISNQIGVQQEILEGISYLSSLLGVWTQGIANAIDPQIEKQRVQRENARDARNRRARNASK